MIFEWIKKKEDFAENLGNSALMVVPFAKFLPLINEIGNFFNETIELVEAAEHNNKRTCEILKNRVHVAELAVRELREKRKDREDFFNKINYIRLQELSIVIARIKKFISEISLMKTLIKYLKEKSVEKVFKELCGEFDVYINLLSFSINVEIADELEQLKSDQDDLFKYLQEMVAGIDDNDCFADSSKKFFSTIVKVNAMNNTMVHFTRGKFRSLTKINDIFQVHPLEFSDYESDDNEKTREYRRVYKWYKKTNKGAEFAFKLIYNRDDQMDLQSRIIILKELHDWQNIIKFYGIIYDGREWHFVNEWAEYGNLREFYQNKNDFDLKLKLRISLDIARGLNFLRIVEISHRDIRAENILITLNETAKLANFSSRYESASKSTLDKYRYYAPEVEPFSENNQMPEEFKQLEIEAVHHDPDFRPKITKMFEVLNNCFKKYSQVTSSSSGPNPSENSRNNSMQKFRPKRADNIDAYALPDLESFKYMTLTDAAMQHRLYNRHGKLAGDLKTAYKCFEAYANLGNTGGTANRNQIKAKYYKAYYISKEFVESPPNKDKIVAELFKEVADNEANEFPEAKVRYGDCLYHGKGVDQNFSEALKYFEKAAEDGFKIAMYNVGDMYYNGVGCTKDIEKAKYYMKLAAYNNYESAITFCKEHDI
ncbi:kinase-like domain-containing protein [Rhizophagus irregularis DAOM 181602=DAOM 197198]|nr:kinase-like domain-containing protein [Rhizophagus irregularis DAOM 181602=DAOM 197198]